MKPNDATAKAAGLILFLVYETEKIPEVLEELRAFIQRCGGVDWTLVQIDNRSPETPWTKTGEEEFQGYVVGGDNSSREFSGWDLAWRESQRHLDTPFEIVVLVNDALKNSKDCTQLRVADQRLIRCLLRWPAVAGWIDTYARVSPEPIDTLFYPMRLRGLPSRRWVCTTFVIFSRPVFEAVQPLVRVTEADGLYYPEYQGEAFSADCGLSPAYQQFLIQHQTRVWRRCYTLDAETYGLFREKTRMILHEGLLGARLEKTSAKWIDFTVAGRRPTRPGFFAKRLQKSDRLWFHYIVLMSSLKSFAEIARAAWVYYRGRLRRGPKGPESTGGK